MWGPHVILTCLIKCIYICDESIERFHLWQHVYHICLNIHVHLIFCHPCKQIMLKIVDLSWRWYGSKVCSGVKGQGVASTKVEFTEEEVLKFDDEKRNIKWITVSSKFCVPFFSELKFLFWSFQFFFTQRSFNLYEADSAKELKRQNSDRENFQPQK